MERKNTKDYGVHRQVGESYTFMAHQCGGPEALQAAIANGEVIELSLIHI